MAALQRLAAEAGMGCAAVPLVAGSHGGDGAWSSGGDTSDGGGGSDSDGDGPAAVSSSRVTPPPS